MEAKIEIGGRVVQAFRVPDNADIAFRLCLETTAPQLDLLSLEKAAVPEFHDPSYGSVAEVGEVELLAEARPIVEAVKQGLRRRLANPVEDGESLRFR